MKKLIFTAAFIGFSSVAFAQVSKNPDQKVKMDNRKAQMQARMAKKKDAHLAKMKSDLNLSSTQVAQIQRMHTEMQSDRQAERKNYLEMRKVYAKKMKAKRENRKTEMKKILSPDQYKKWEMQQLANLQKRKEKMKERKNKMIDRKMQKRNAPFS